jgi:hypothetical protein
LFALVGISDASRSHGFIHETKVFLDVRFNANAFTEWPRFGSAGT